MARNEVGQSDPLESEEPIKVVRPPGVVVPPSAPAGPLKISDVTAELVTLSWQPPLEDGGGTLTAYVIEAKDVLDIEVVKTYIYVPPSSSEFTAIGLKTKHIYQFRVYAENEAGRGDGLLHKAPVRLKANLKKPSSPGKPVAEIDPEKDDSVLLSWTPPDCDGGSSMLSYIIERYDLLSDLWVRVNSNVVTETTFKVSNLIPGLEYSFRVSAENEVGVSRPGRESEGIVLIARRRSAPPAFTNELTDQSVVVGEEVTFCCEFTGTPSPDITWYKKGIQVYEIGRFRIETGDGQSSFTVADAKLEDEGTVECRAQNSVGWDITEAELILLAPPKITIPPSYLEGLVFDSGETIRLKLGFSAKPDPETTWLVNSREVKEDYRTDILLQMDYVQLRIHDAGRSDSGLYHLRLHNPLGEVTAQLQVTVTDKPDSPGAPSVCDIDWKACTLSWKAPDLDGGSPIMSYIIEKRQADMDVWVRATTTHQTTATAYDLIEGAQYLFRVRAVNIYGFSDPSKESELVLIPDIKSELSEEARRKSSTGLQLSSIDNEDDVLAEESSLLDAHSIIEDEEDKMFANEDRKSSLAKSESSVGLYSNPSEVSWERHKDIRQLEQSSMSFSSMDDYFVPENRLPQFDEDDSENDQTNENWYSLSQTTSESASSFDENRSPSIGSEEIDVPISCLSTEMVAKAIEKWFLRCSSVPPIASRECQSEEVFCLVREETTECLKTDCIETDVLHETVELDESRQCVLVELAPVLCESCVHLPIPTPHSDACSVPLETRFALLVYIPPAIGYFPKDTFVYRYAAVYFDMNVQGQTVSGKDANNRCAYNIPNSEFFSAETPTFDSYNYQKNCEIAICTIVFHDSFAIVYAPPMVLYSLIAFESDFSTESNQTVAFMDNIVSVITGSPPYTLEDLENIDAHHFTSMLCEPTLSMERPCVLILDDSPLVIEPLFHLPLGEQESDKAVLNVHETEAICKATETSVSSSQCKIAVSVLPFQSEETEFQSEEYIDETFEKDAEQLSSCTLSYPEGLIIEMLPEDESLNKQGIITVSNYIVEEPEEAQQPTVWTLSDIIPRRYQRLDTITEASEEGTPTPTTNSQKLPPWLRQVSATFASDTTADLELGKEFEEQDGNETNLTTTINDYEKETETVEDLIGFAEAVEKDFEVRSLEIQRLEESLSEEMESLERDMKLLHIIQDLLQDDDDEEELQDEDEELFGHTEGLDESKNLVQTSSKEKRISYLDSGIPQTLTPKEQDILDWSLSDEESDDPLLVQPRKEKRHFPPEIVSHLQNRIIPAGYRVKLACSVIADPEPSIKWLKNGKDLSPKLRHFYVNMFDFGLCSVEIYNSKSTDTGEYSCIASNPYGSASTSCYLRVSGDKELSPVLPRFEKLPSDVTVHQGGRIELEWVIAGVPPPKVSWLKNDHELHSDWRVDTYTNHRGLCRLVIRDARTADSAIYSCVIENDSGRSAASVMVLVVLDADEEFDEPTLEPTEDLVSTCRDRLEATGVAADIDEGNFQDQRDQEDYPLVSDNDGELLWDLEEYREIVLQEERKSSRTYRHLNYCEWQESLRKSLKEAHGLPGPPENPTVTDRGKTHLTLAWLRPLVQGDSPVVSYLIEIRDLDSNYWREVGLSRTAVYDVYGLRPNRTYVFRVSARNQFGWGPPVTMTTPVHMG